MPSTNVTNNDERFYTSWWFTLLSIILAVGLIAGTIWFFFFKEEETPDGGETNTAIEGAQNNQNDFGGSDSSDDDIIFDGGEDTRSENEKEADEGRIVSDFEIGEKVEMSNGATLSIDNPEFMNENGRDIICAEVSFKNSDNAFNIYGIDWKVQLPSQEISIPVMPGLDIPEDNHLQVGELPKNEKRKGKVCFDAKDEPGRYTFVYDPTYNHPELEVYSWRYDN